MNCAPVTCTSIQHKALICWLLSAEYCMNTASKRLDNRLINCEVGDCTNHEAVEGRRWSLTYLR